MVLPSVAYFSIFSYYTLAQGVIISFQDFRLIGDTPFIGFENYLYIFHDPYFWQALLNTIIIGGGILILGFFPPILLALLLNEVTRLFFKKITQTIIYIPRLFSWVIIGGIIIYILSPDGGLINEILLLFGVIEQPIHFLAEYKYARWIMILSPIWKDTGYNCILYLAAIDGINPLLYEAADIDGATRIQKMFHITLPQLVPTMKVVFLINTMGVLRIFDQIFVLKNSLIDPKVNVLMTYLYEKGLIRFQMGRACAAGTLIVISTWVIVKVVRKVIKYDAEE